MDVDKIQKINKLAVDLMNQGLANNREEAVAQAEHIYSRGADDYSTIRVQMHDMKPPEFQKSSDTEDLSQDQIKQILEQNTTFIVKSLRQFQEKVVLLEKEIGNLKEQMKAVPTVREIISEVKAQPQSLPQTPEQKSSSIHPRSGHYNDTDVSIEKYFYMGKK